MGKRIAVIGGGVIGLTTAIQVQKEIAGANVTIFTETLSPNTTADVSAGYWSPYLLQNTPPANVAKWSKCTLNYALDLWKNGKSDEYGISLIPSINLTVETDAKLPEWGHIALGFHRLNDRQLKLLGERHKKLYKSGFRFVSVIIEPIKLLPKLVDEFLANGGKIIMKKIESFDELTNDYDVIANCCGLSARNLCDDVRVAPIRGQIARVRAPWQFHVLNVDDNYIIPNSECVILGGTHQNDYDLGIRDNDKVSILNGCQNIVAALKNVDILKHQVGLRPGRDVVRVELETRGVNGKTTKIVHNYGHGGSGVTLCMGCAKDACDLVRSALTLPSKL